MGGEGGRREWEGKEEVRVERLSGSLWFVFFLQLHNYDWCQR